MIGLLPMPKLSKPKELWQPGDLFHVCSRYPRKAGAPRVDRLAGILRSGIVAPAHCDGGSVVSDLSMEVIGTPIPYDSLVFLHRFGPSSALYTICETDRFAVFVDPGIPVMSPGDMGPIWAVLCMDEVYVRDTVPVEDLIGVAVHPLDAESVLDEFRPDLDRLGIPLYLYDGTVVWPQAGGEDGGRGQPSPRDRRDLR